LTMLGAQRHNVLEERAGRPVWGHRIFSGKIYAKPEVAFYRILMRLILCPWDLSAHAFSSVCVVSSENLYLGISRN
jgi:hypothetical protein